MMLIPNFFMQMSFYQTSLELLFVYKQTFYSLDGHNICKCQLTVV